MCAEEKFRQQTASLNQMSEELEIADEENSILLRQQMEHMKLSKWNEQIDDEEICRNMNDLYRELEAWTKRRLSHCESSIEYGSLYSLWEIVSYKIFERFLGPELIAMGGETIQGFVRIELLRLSDEVRKTCPPHIAQHWMPALSKAAFSCYEYPLKHDIEELAVSIERYFGQNYSTNEQKRQKQLRSLISKFVDFKATLEGQNERYHFVFCAAGEDFDDSTMISFTGQFGFGLTVKLTISPALLKRSQGNSPVLVVQKARVLTAQTVQPIDPQSMNVDEVERQDPLAMS